jgi:hypothetical protein
MTDRERVAHMLGRGTGLTDREHLAQMADALVRDGLLRRRRGGWYDVVGGDFGLLPEEAGRQVDEIQQITHRNGDTILGQTVLIKFRGAVRETARRRRSAASGPAPGHGRRVH